MIYSPAVGLLTGGYLIKQICVMHTGFPLSALHIAPRGPTARDLYFFDCSFHRDPEPTDSRATYSESSDFKTSRPTLSISPLLACHLNRQSSPTDSTGINFSSVSPIVRFPRDNPGAFSRDCNSRSVATRFFSRDSDPICPNAKLLTSRNGTYQISNTEFQTNFSPIFHWFCKMRLAWKKIFFLLDSFRFIYTTEHVYNIISEFSQ